MPNTTQLLCHSNVAKCCRTTQLTLGTFATRLAAGEQMNTSIIRECGSSPPFGRPSAGDTPYS